ARHCPERQRVVQRNRLKGGPELVIPVGPHAENAKREIDFREGANADSPPNGHRLPTVAPRADPRAAGRPVPPGSCRAVVREVQPASAPQGKLDRPTVESARETPRGRAACSSRPAKALAADRIPTAPPTRSSNERHAAEIGRAHV